MRIEGNRCGTTNARPASRIWISPAPTSQVDPTPKDLHYHLNTVEAPLNTLNTPDLCPGSSALERINASLR